MPRLEAKYRKSRSGKTLLHEMRINPTHAEIDESYRIFRDDLRAGIEFGDIEKDGDRFHLVGNNQHECGIYLPAKRWFTLQDVTESKRVLKAHRDAFLRMRDWNNVETFERILKSLQVKKPLLMAHLILAAWKHDNVNVDESYEHVKYATIWLRGGSYILMDKTSKLYVKGVKNGEAVFVKKRSEAKAWKRESSAWTWLEKKNLI